MGPTPGIKSMPIPLKPTIEPALATWTPPALTEIPVGAVIAPVLALVILLPSPPVPMKTPTPPNGVPWGTKAMPLLTSSSFANCMTTAPKAAFGEPTTTPDCTIHCWLAAVKVRLGVLVERVGMSCSLRGEIASCGTLPQRRPLINRCAPGRSCPQLTHHHRIDLSGSAEAAGAIAEQMREASGGRRVAVRATGAVLP